MYIYISIGEVILQSLIWYLTDIFCKGLKEKNILMFLLAWLIQVRFHALLIKPASQCGIVQGSPFAFAVQLLRKQVHGQAKARHQY